jgi:hypothetical protein
VIRTNRTARRARTAVGAALAAAALTACGAGQAHPGAAAVVGGDRITIAAVETGVAEVRATGAGQDGSPQPEQAGLVRAMVNQMIYERVVDRALTDHQLTVSAAEVAELRAAQAGELGGEAKLQQAFAGLKGVPASGIDAYYRQLLGRQKLAAMTGQPEDPASPAVGKALEDAATELKIEVNPRYGHWDPQQAGLADTVDSWLPHNGTAA